MENVITQPIISQNSIKEEADKLKKISENLHKYLTSEKKIDDRRLIFSMIDRIDDVVDEIEHRWK